MKFFRRLKRNKKGFTLVELIVATLILAMISVSLSSILGSTLTVYNRTEMNTVLYNVSQKLHVALDNEIIASRDLSLYERNIDANSVIKKEYQYCISKSSDGYLYKYAFDPTTKKVVEENLLLTEKSYRGSEVKELYYSFEGIEERVSYSDSTKKKCWRIVKITTTVSKNGVDYTHTSTVRLYNMSIYGTEIKVLSAGKSGDPKVPTRTDDIKYAFILYYATQYFEV